MFVDIGYLDLLILCLNFLCICLKGCQWATLRLVKCLGVNGVASALNSTKGTRVHSRLGITVLSPRLKHNATGLLQNLIKELRSLQMDTGSYDWLITARSDQDFRHINKILNETTIRFDQNVVVAYSTRKYHTGNPLQGLCDTNFSYKSQGNLKSQKMTCHDGNFIDKMCLRHHDSNKGPRRENVDGYYRTTERFKNLSKNNTYRKFGHIWPLFNTGAINYNYSRNFEMTNISRFSLERSSKTLTNATEYKANTIKLVQYFKVRINSTLYAHYLGNWNREWSMSHIEEPYPVEARNFLGEDMVVGRCNSSGDGATALDDDGPSAPASLEDVLDFLTVRLNSTPWFYTENLNTWISSMT